ncbi:PaaI family thioesterase [Streptomyces sp. NPDC056049]|uniref:PaaI family thioesterase n=1 Tax=Streptomyces sp. NPDC056049 TaxID=3345693 RepID=UPI0035DDAB33
MAQQPETPPEPQAGERHDEQASPAVRRRLRVSFDRQGRRARLGARLARLARTGPRRGHIVLPSCPEATRQHGHVRAGATSSIADSANSAGGCVALTLLDEAPDVLTVEYKINLLAPAAGDHLEAVGTVVRSSGRPLTLCWPEVYGFRADGSQKLLANGRQPLIRVDRSAE